LPAIPAFSPQEEKAENRHEIVPSQSVFAVRAKRTARAKTDAFVEPINHAIQKAAYNQAENENSYGFKKHFLKYADRQRSNKKIIPLHRKNRSTFKTDSFLRNSRYPSCTKKIQGRRC